MSNPNTIMTSVGEPLRLDDEHLVTLSDELRVYDRLDVTVDQSPSEADAEETEDSINEEEKSIPYADIRTNPIPVEPKLRNGVLSEAKRCRRCHYDGRYRCRSRGPNGGCDKCLATNIKCNPCLTGIVPYHRNGRRLGSRLPPLHKSPVSMAGGQRAIAKQQSSIRHRGR